MDSEQALKYALHDNAPSGFVMITANVAVADEEIVSIKPDKRANNSTTGPTPMSMFCPPNPALPALPVPSPVTNNNNKKTLHAVKKRAYTKHPKPGNNTASIKKKKGKTTTAAAVHGSTTFKSFDKKMPIEKKIVAVMAEFRALNIRQIPRIQVALKTGYKNVRSAGFAKGLKALKVDGLVAFPNKETVQLTDKGVEAASQIVVPPRTNEQVHDGIKKMLKPKSRALFESIADGATYVRKDVASACGYSNERSEGFAGSLSEMSSLGLMEFPKDVANPKVKLIRLADICFPHGRHATAVVNVCSIEEEEI